VRILSRKLWWVLFIVGTVAWLSWMQGERQSEPLWHGRSLTSWVDDLARGSSKEVREPAEEAIRQIGPKALPTLLRMLRARDSALNRGLLWLNRKQHVVHLSVRPAREEQMQAVLAFEALGPVAKPAIPELRKMLLNTEPEAVADALANIGPESVTVLLEAIPGIASQKRCALFAAAAKWPSHQAATVNALLVALRSTNAEERRCAAEFLGRLRGHPIQTIPALIAALDDPEFAVRFQALKSLVSFGTNAQSAVEILRERMGKPGSFPPDALSNAVLQIRLSSGGEAN
jgi:HEAT repeat protein